MTRQVTNVSCADVEVTISVENTGSATEVFDLGFGADIIAAGVDAPQITFLGVDRHRGAAFGGLWGIYAMDPPLFSTMSADGSPSSQIWGNGDRELTTADYFSASWQGLSVEPAGVKTVKVLWSTELVAPAVEATRGATRSETGIGFLEATPMASGTPAETPCANLVGVALFMYYPFDVTLDRARTSFSSGYSVFLRVGMNVVSDYVGGAVTNGNVRMRPGVVNVNCATVIVNLNVENTGSSPVAFDIGWGADTVIRGNDGAAPFTWEEDDGVSGIYWTAGGFGMYAMEPGPFTTMNTNGDNAYPTASSVWVDGPRSITTTGSFAASWQGQSVGVGRNSTFSIMFSAQRLPGRSPVPTRSETGIGFLEATPTVSATPMESPCPFPDLLGWQPAGCAFGVALDKTSTTSYDGYTVVVRIGSSWYEWSNGAIRAESLTLVATTVQVDCANVIVNLIVNNSGPTATLFDIGWYADMRVNGRGDSIPFTWEEWDTETGVFFDDTFGIYAYEPSVFSTMNLEPDPFLNTNRPGNETTLSSFAASWQSQTIGPGETRVFSLLFTGSRLPLAPIASRSETGVAFFEDTPTVSATARETPCPYPNLVGFQPVDHPFDIQLNGTRTATSGGWQVMLRQGAVTTYAYSEGAVTMGTIRATAQTVQQDCASVLVYLNVLNLGTTTQAFDIGFGANTAFGVESDGAAPFTWEEGHRGIFFTNAFGVFATDPPEFTTVFPTTSNNIPSSFFEDASRTGFTTAGAFAASWQGLSVEPGLVTTVSALFSGVRPSARTPFDATPSNATLARTGTLASEGGTQARSAADSVSQQDAPSGSPFSSPVDVSTGEPKNGTTFIIMCVAIGAAVIVMAVIVGIVLSCRSRAKSGSVSSSSLRCIPGQEPIKTIELTCDWSTRQSESRSIETIDQDY